MPLTFAASSIHTMRPIELHDLYRLRVDVFVHEQQCPYAEIDNADALPTTVHLRALHTPREPEPSASDQPMQSDATSGQLLGAVRLFPDIWEGEAVARIGRFVVSPEHRGTVVGPELLRRIIQLSSRHHATAGRPIMLTAQSPLRGYYEGFGFQVCGEEFLEDGIPHLPMRLYG